jgi:ABC-type multidrug transport system fused ATPase/permease subunit
VQPDRTALDARQRLGHLGDGGERDRLDWRLILELLRRCLRLLVPVRGHLIALCAGFAGLAIVFVPPVVLGFDLFWTRVLQGEALTDFQIGLFGLDPALWGAADGLAQAERHALARQVVVWGAVVIAVLFPIGAALYYYQVWILQRINQELRLELLERLQSLSLRFHADSRVGDALYRLYQDSAMVTQLIEVMILAPLSAVGRHLFCLVVVAVFDPGLAGVLAVTWPPTLWIAHAMTRRMRVAFRRSRESNSHLTSRIQETLVGIRVIKAYGAERFEQERFDESSLGAFAAAFRARNGFAFFQVAVFWVIGTTALTATAMATLDSRDGVPIAVAVAGFTAWNLGLYNYFKVRVGDATNSARDLFKTWGRVQDVSIGLDRVFEILDIEPEVKDAPDAVPLETVGEGVSFRDVSFAYADDRPVLRDVDFDAPTGTITAIVGPTGSGKSTLVALLLRLFDPGSGRVLVDGRDLREFTTASLRSQVAIALQENLLFGDTVRENIRYAVPDADDAAVREAARVACADGFIESLPDGYDTVLGERGTKLSTGQRQRLSIARAVLKDTPVLILDEPTASLDAATELAVLENLAEWGRHRTIFLITHRLSTVRRADRIVFLRAGRVEEAGSHDELMTRTDGAYRRLVEREMAPLAAVEAAS